MVNLVTFSIDSIIACGSLIMLGRTIQLQIKHKASSKLNLKLWISIFSLTSIILSVKTISDTRTVLRVEGSEVGSMLGLIIASVIAVYILAYIFGYFFLIKGNKN